MNKTMLNNKYTSIDEYIVSFSNNVQLVLKQIKSVINKIAPTAVESISYSMPTFKLNGKPLVYFAAYKNHIGFYALPSSHKVFLQQLSKYKHGKGSVQFSLDKPMPIKLITKIIKYRIKELEVN
jgi:uncharacterized protein YdhG (YjbR/CyaY superfamily)